MTRAKILQTENSRTILTLALNNPNDQMETYEEPKAFTQFLAAGIATLSALAMGTTLSWSSPAIPMIQQEHPDLKFTDKEGAVVGSIITMGAFLGAIPGGAIANKFGRKISLLCLAVVLFLHWIVIAFSFDMSDEPVVTIAIARIIGGFAIGAVSVAAPLYVSELAHTSVRGTLGTFFQVQITIGLLIGYIFGGTITDFKWLALASSTVPLVFLATFGFMPETPVHSYTKGDVSTARTSLTYFRGEGYDVEEELDRIAEDIKAATANRTNVLTLFSDRACVKALVISLGLMAFQQFSGINAVLFYAGPIFDEAGSAISPDICAIIIGIVQVLATLVSTLLIERAGRKILLFISASVMCLCLLVLGTYFYLKEHYDLQYLNILPIICVGTFIVVFSIGFGPIPWIMMGELFTSKAKGFAGSLSAALSWLSAFTVTNQFQNLRDGIGPGFTFGLFGLICGLGVVFVALLVPETKGKDEEALQKILSGNKGCANCSEKCNKTTYV